MILVALFWFSAIPKNVLGGTLSLNSDSASGSSSSSSTGNYGHSWIEYVDDSGRRTTYGNWPGGVKVNYEGDINHRKTAVASISYNDDQWASRVLPFINSEIEKGSGAWSLTCNCSTFASNVWSISTHEQISPNPRGPMPDNPTTLVDRINERNGWGGVWTSGGAGLESKPIQNIDHENFKRLVSKRYFERRTE